MTSPTSPTPTSPAPQTAVGTSSGPGGLAGAHPGRAAGAPGTVRPALAPLAALLAGALALLVCLTRQPGHPLDNLIAEDGTRFLPDGYRLPLGRAILAPYSAYLHLYPRLSGAVAAAVPTMDAARVLTVAGCLTTAVAVAAIVVSTRTLIRSLPLRLLTAVAIPLLPNGGSEAIANVANAHVWLDLLGLVALLRPLPHPGARRSPGWAGRTGWQVLETVAGWLAVLLAIGSDPLALGLIPVAVLRAVVVHQRVKAAEAGRPGGAGEAAGGPRVGVWALTAEIVPIAILVLGGLVQLVTVATHKVPSARTHPPVTTLTRLYLRDVLASVVLGTRHSVAAGRGVLLLLALAAAAALVVTAVRSHARGAAAAGLLVLSYLLYLPAPWLKWLPALSGVSGLRVHDARYTVLAGALLLIAGAVCLDVWLRRRVPLAVAIVILVTVGALTWIPTFHTGPLRVPSWSAGVRAAQQRCDAHPTARVVRIPVAPAPFLSTIACSRVR